MIRPGSVPTSSGRQYLAVPDYQPPYETSYDNLFPNKPNRHHHPDSMSVRTVKVSNVSLGASEQDIKEFFSFSGDIEYVDMQSENERAQKAFVTFKNPQCAETAVLLSGATIVDQSVTIALAPEYTLPASVTTPSVQQPTATEEESGGVVQKAEDVVSSMLAKGFILGKDAFNRAKSFDQKHQVSSTAAAKAATIDQKTGLSEKINMGTTIVNEKVKEMDQRFQVSEKTKTAFATAEQTVSVAGSAIMKNRYVLTGTSWVAGAFSRVTKAAGEVGQKTMEKVSEEEQQAAAKTQTPTHLDPQPPATSTETHQDLPTSQKPTTSTSPKATTTNATATS